MRIEADQQPVMVNTIDGFLSYKFAHLFIRRVYTCARMWSFNGRVNWLGDNLSTTKLRMGKQPFITIRIFSQLQRSNFRLQVQSTWIGFDAHNA